MLENKIRVRYAPSPTGLQHVGGLRSCLHNWLFAKQNNGAIILRIEDTDQTRFVEGAEQYIEDSFAWLGIEFDESPSKGGPYGPYRQSERKDIYKKYVDQLIADGHAYYAFDTTEELEAKREEVKKMKGIFSYNSYTRERMSNSLTLPADTVEEKLSSGQPYVIRLKVPKREEIRFHDTIRGNVMVVSDTVDDKVLMKSDGMPTYHLANVVDDHLMEITHVIRGEEWLPSAPFHILLYRAFGWETPVFAHLPLLLAPADEGNKKEKLSKRHGDKYGFPIYALSGEYKKEDGTLETVTGYREAGYLRDAVLNFLFIQGWHPSGEKEILSLQEAIDLFSLERVGKAGIQFDYKKLNWFNAQYLRNIPDAELVDDFIAELLRRDISCSVEKAMKIIPLAKERSVFKKDLFDNIDYFFSAPNEFKKEIFSQDVADVMYDLTQRIIDDMPTSGLRMKEKLLEIIKERELKNIKILKPFRDAITGVESGPELHNIFDVLGEKEVLGRMKRYLQYMGVL